MPDPTEAVPGAHAHSPWHMPWAAWKDVLIRTWNQSGTDNIGLAAAGVAFYGFTALVPLLAATVLIYGLAADPNTVVKDVQSMIGVVPKDAAKLIGEQLMGVVKSSSDKKGLGLALAILIALWGARSGAGSVVTALNIAYEEKERRSFVRLTLLSLGITAVSVMVFIFALAAVAALGHLGDLLPALPGFVLAIGKVLSYVVLVLAGSAGAATLYRYGPDRARAKWVWITPGSLIAAVVWFLLTALFGLYVADFGSYNATYGSLGAVVVFLTWLYLSSYILLLGAEMNAEMERQTQVDTTNGPPRPAGQRGAAVADAKVTPATRRDPEAVTPPPPRPASTLPGAGKQLAAGKLGSVLARIAGLEKAGAGAALIATAGLSALRRQGRAGLGIALLAAGGALAWLGREDPDAD